MTKYKFSSQSEEKSPAWRRRLLANISEKSLFDWLQVFGSAAVPFFLFLLTLVQVWSGLESRKQDLKIADDSRQEEIMSKYLEQMTTLVTEKDLGLPSMKPGVQDMARALTQNAARRLDSDGKGKLLKLLYEGHLIGGGCKFDTVTQVYKDCNKTPIVDLKEVRLDKITSLDNATFDPNNSLSLPGVDLAGALLPGAELPNVALPTANMSQIRLTGANLEKANLVDANLEQARLQDAKLTGAALVRAKLAKADLRNATLNKADLRGAHLTKAFLTNADLQEASLEWADLTGASVQNANFKGTTFNTQTKFPVGFDAIGAGMVQKPD